MPVYGALDIREVLDGLFPEDCERELVVMLRAFADAGQTFPGANLAPSFTVAGFMGECRAWSRFQKAWRRACRSAGIDYFHMADFEARSPKYGYDKWSEGKREAVLNRLIQIIIETVMFGVSATIRKADYDSLTREQKFNLCADNPYSFCANSCIGRMARHMLQAAPGERAIYVFEMGDKGEKEFTKAMLEQIEKLPGKNREMGILSYMPGSKEDFPHLAAADFLAWEINRHFPKHLGLDTDPIRPSLAKLACKVELHPYYYSASDLAKFADAAPQEDAEYIQTLGCRVIPANPKKPYTW